MDEFLAADDDLDDQEETKEPSERQPGQSERIFDPEASNISATMPTN